VIHVDRYREEDGQVIKPSDDWFDMAEQRTAVAIEQGAAHEVTALYKHVQVKMALEKLFFVKCAYCESSPVASNPWDVEHYRPKGRVAECTDHPGYYWLAYKWENLFFACADCNRSRKDQARYDDPQALSAQGKLDQFPVENEDYRAMSPDENLSAEQPLLLNPCNDHDPPENHLRYDIQGHIRPSNEHDLRATETIRICHLKRRRLRVARAKTINRVSKMMGFLRLAREKGNSLAEESMLDLISDCVAPDALYAGAARAVQRDPDAFIVAG